MGSAHHAPTVQWRGRSCGRNDATVWGDDSTKSNMRTMPVASGWCLSASWLATLYTSLKRYQLILWHWKCKYRDARIGHHSSLQYHVRSLPVGSSICWALSHQEIQHLAAYLRSMAMSLTHLRVKLLVSNDYCCLWFLLQTCRESNWENVFSPEMRQNREHTVPFGREYARPCGALEIDMRVSLMSSGWNGDLSIRLRNRALCFTLASFPSPRSHFLSCPTECSSSDTQRHLSWAFPA